MTEEEWLTSSDPESVLEFLGNRASERKQRLAMVACASRVPAHILCPEIEEAVKHAILLAEGQASPQIAEAFRSTMHERASEFSCLPLAQKQKSQAEIAIAVLGDATPLRGVTGISHTVGQVIGTSFDENGHKLHWHWTPDIGRAVGVEYSAACRIVREIFGNPFRPITIDPAWLHWNDGTIPKVAQAIYEKRRFQDMPILADALEEAGCRNADILSHCRTQGPHVRGCWAVDLILGKQ